MGVSDKVHVNMRRAGVMTEETLRVPRGLTAPLLARSFVADLLHKWGCDQLENRVVLAVSEVITNAVLHAHSTTVLQVRYNGDTLEIRIRDEDDALPTPRQPTADDDSGRGLRVLAAIADRWGVEPLHEGGKVVFASFDC
jgi:anti-sigma regulatory factor (Ser/Thr protein kinase)